MELKDLCRIAVETGASDLHLKVKSFPMLRLRGELTPVSSDHGVDGDEMVRAGARGTRPTFKSGG